MIANREPATPTAEAAPASEGRRFFGSGEAERLRGELESTKGELELLRAQFERADRILRYSTQYRIGGDLAGQIFDVALAEGIDPDLAFRLVKLESDFNPRATSPVGAIGLTQVMPPTARYFDRNITRDKLYDPKTNLRIGFRYLRTLLGQYRGNARLALLVYNRGPAAVNNALAAGVDPSNGYERIVMKGYRGKPVVD